MSHRYTVPCDQAGESCPLQRSLQSGQRERVLHLHHTPKGEIFENIELSPIRDASGEIAYYIEKLEPMPGARSLVHAQGLIGRSPAFVGMMEMVARVAPAEAAVLLQGESGTGKELVANAIHQISKRAEKPAGRRAARPPGRGARSSLPHEGLATHPDDLTGDGGGRR